MEEKSNRVRARSLKHRAGVWVPAAGIVATCLVSAGAVLWSVVVTPGAPVAEKSALASAVVAQIIGGAVFIRLIARGAAPLTVNIPTPTPEIKAKESRQELDG